MSARLCPHETVRFLEERTVPIYKGVVALSQVLTSQMLSERQMVQTWWVSQPQRRMNGL